MKDQRDGYDREFDTNESKKGKTELVKLQDKFCAYFFGAVVCVGLASFFFIEASIFHTTPWVDLGIFALMGTASTLYFGIEYLRKYLAVPKEVRNPTVPTFPRDPS